MGIEPEKFASTVDEDFICWICTLVLEDPVKIAGCEHMFCRLCINEWMKNSLTCPVDRKMINKRFDLIAPDRTVVNLLNKFKIKCEFELLGCDVVVRFEIWNRHVNECDFNPANKWTCEGCEKIVTKKEADRHSCVDNLKVKIINLKQTIDELSFLVKDFQLKNKKLEEENKKLKNKNEEQSDLIKQIVNENEKNQNKYEKLLKENEDLKLSQSLKKTSVVKTNPLVNIKPSPSVNSRTCLYQELEYKTKTSLINNWPILSRLPFHLKSRIKLASILETVAYHDAVIITNDDQAFWIRAHKFKGQQNFSKPIKIDQLSGLKIKWLKFNIGLDATFNVVALNEDGKLLTCSFARDLLDGKASDNFKPTVNLNQKIVVQVDIGYEHKLALTMKGEVFAWGDNKCGQLGVGTDKNLNQNQLMKVTAEIGSRRTVAVACCSHSSFAVMGNGKVFAWGSNRYGQLGIGNQQNQTVPKRIESLAGIKIRRLVCGIGHVLAVADDGSMFAWGYNWNGQLGTGDKENRDKPVKIEPFGVKFIEVAACDSYYYSHMSVALSEDGRVWVWGRCRTKIGFIEIEDVLFPKPVQSTSIHDAIADYAEYQTTWNTIAIRQ